MLQDLQETLQNYPLITGRILTSLIFCVMIVGSLSASPSPKIINTQLKDWTLDSVVLAGNRIATLFFSKEFHLNSPYTQIRVRLPSNVFSQPEAWTIPTISTITTEQMKEPLSPDAAPASQRLKKWKDSLTTLKATVRKLKIQLETINAGLDVLQKNRKLPENTTGSSTILNQWLSNHMTMTESLLTQKARLEQQIDQMEKQIRAIESFLKGNVPNSRFQNVVLIRPYCEKAGNYKIILRVHSRAYRLTPQIHVYVQQQTSQGQQYLVNAYWTVQISQSTGIDWNNTTIVYYPELPKTPKPISRKPGNQSLEIPARYLVTFAEIYRKRRQRLYMPRFYSPLGGPARKKRSLAVVKTESEVPQEPLPPKAEVVEESKLLPAVIRIQHATILDRTARTFQLMHKEIKDATVELYAFSGSEFAVYVLEVPSSELFPLIAPTLSLYYNGNLVGRRKLHTEEMIGERVRIPLLTHPLIRIRTTHIETIQRSGLRKRTATAYFSVAIISTARDTLSLRYATLVRLASTEVGYTLQGVSPETFTERVQGIDRYVTWTVQIAPSQTTSQEFRIVFTTRKKYRIRVKVFTRDVF